MKLDDEEQQILNDSDNYQEPSDIDTSLEARLGFIKKVYLIINFQIFLTGIITLLQIHFSDKKVMITTQFWLAVIIAILLIICLLCDQHYARKTPKNYILLIIFSFCQGYAISEICCFAAWKYEIGIDLIQIAIFMTFTMIAVQTLFVFVTNDNFTLSKSLKLTLILSLVITFICYLIQPIYFKEIIYLILAIFVYSLYVIYDISKIFDTKRHSLQKNDYILGALFLQVDMIFILQDNLKSLSQLGKKK